MQFLQPDASAVQSHGSLVNLSMSDIVSIVSVLATVAGIMFGVYQMREASRAKTDARKARTLLLRQVVSQHFTDSTDKALKLFTAIRQSKWGECSEIAILLLADLANALGFPEHLIGKNNKENIGIAVELMHVLIRKLPLSGSDQDGNLSLELIQKCQVVLATVNVVEGSLRLHTALGGEDDEHTSASSLSAATAYQQLGSD